MADKKEKTITETIEETEAVLTVEVISDPQAKTEQEIQDKVKKTPVPKEEEKEEPKKRGRPPGAKIGGAKKKKKKRPEVFTKEIGELWVIFLNVLFNNFNLDPIDKEFASKYAEVSAKFFDKKFGDKFEDEETAMFVIMTGFIAVGKYSEAKDKGFTVWDKIKNIIPKKKTPGEKKEQEKETLNVVS